MTDATATATGRRLVLCFDGTSNKFSGDETDTNIVKLYEMFNRRTGNQYHYYQPGIGSYVEGQIANSSTGNIFTYCKNYIIETYDMAFGSSFVHHVVAGYNFLMRFYEPGDKIFVFGFSRGAYTARFLCEMIYNIGLLSRGNEEMVRFAWATFSDFQRTRGEDPKFKDFMLRFKETYCREHITVHFLGLFDCVNSVAQFQIPIFGKRSSPHIPVPPAEHIRHAVSIHERRLMFKPALFLVEPEANKERDIKEVYFSGNHGDVGGGWSYEGTQHLLSDIPLKWMVDEIQALPEKENLLSWFQPKVDEMLEGVKEFESILSLKRILTENEIKNQKKNPIRRLVHDVLVPGRGASLSKFFLWWTIEIFPFAYYDLRDGKWEPVWWPPNYGSRRDIPLEADIHPSVLKMREAGMLTAKDMPALGGRESAAYR